MGSNTGEREERPAHRVTITKAFAIGQTEITQVQWRAVMQDQWRTIGGKDPSYFKSCGDDCPVEQVSWNDAQIFIQKLNAKTRKQYRLPTEAEWEYACRAGSQFNSCGGGTLSDIAWHSESLDSTGKPIQGTMPVAGKHANAFGLYDMNGNVWEWVADSYHDNYLNSPKDGDVWQSDGKRRVLRGGSWFNSAQSMSASKRFKEAPVAKSKFYGLRVVRVLP
jgi:formylglycine-generating enzyme required for sulfatase activity